MHSEPSSLRISEEPAASVWLIKTGADEHGPFEPGQLQDLIDTALIVPSTPIRRVDEDEWQALDAHPVASELRLPRKLSITTAKSFARVNAPPGSFDPEPIVDIKELLRRNVEHDRRVERVEPVLPRRCSRRLRDYLAMLAAGNLVLVGLMAVMPRNPVVLAFGISGMIFFSAGFTWFMWVVVDDY